MRWFVRIIDRASRSIDQGFAFEVGRDEFVKIIRKSGERNAMNMNQESLHLGEEVHSRLLHARFRDVCSKA